MHTHSLVFRVASILSIEDEIWNHLSPDISILQTIPSDGVMITYIDSNGVPWPYLEGKMNEWLNESRQKDNGLVWWQRVEEEDLYNA